MFTTVNIMLIHIQSNIFGRIAICKFPYSHGHGMRKSLIKKANTKVQFRS